MKIWVTTDTHFNHQKLIEMGVRPPDFEEQIKENLMNLVAKDDLLIHLGDICIGKEKTSSNWFKQNLLCRTVLVRGNHDHKSTNFYLDNGWDFCCTRFDLTIFGKRFAFTHSPIPWDGFFEINLHGHLHNCSHRNDKVNGYNHLVSLERNNYLPELLESFVKK